MTVAVVSCIYGHDYDQFIPDWYGALDDLDRQPNEIILHRGERQDGELYPQPRLMNEAIALASSEWVWQLNVDDLALPDGLTGIDTVAADVWLMGYRFEDGEQYVPEALPNRQFLNMSGNPYPSMSAYRREAFEEVGGYPVIAHEDWGLWRRLARAGYTFESSGRPHSIYQRHPLQRSATELLTGNPELMLREVMADG
jgi:hypothetical protein